MDEEKYLKTIKGEVPDEAVSVPGDYQPECDSEPAQGNGTLHE
jgi:hypothetical protein